MYNSYAETAVGVSLIIFYIIFYLLIVGVAVATYILSSLSLQKIAKRRQISKPWLAWIPVGNYWIVGSIADEYESHFGINKKWRVRLLSLNIIFFAVFLLFYVSFFVWMIVTIINFRDIGMSGVFAPIIAFFVVMVLMEGIAILMTVFYYMALYKVYRSTAPEKSVMYLMLSIFVTYASTICLFLCRDKGYSIPQMSCDTPPQNTGYYQQKNQ